MVDINLERIKALTKVPLSKYYNLRNQYSWEEVYDTSNDKRLLDVPLYNRSKDTEMYLRRVFSSGQKSYVLDYLPYNMLDNLQKIEYCLE